MRPLGALSENELESWGNSQIETLANHYGVEKVHQEASANPIVDKESTMREWQLAKKVVRSQGYPRNSISTLWKVLRDAHAGDLPNLIKLAMLALTCPIHTAECERGFSVQNHIKTSLRNRLSPERLDDLATVAILGPVSASFDPCAVLNLWLERKQRKLFN